MKNWKETKNEKGLVTRNVYGDNEIVVDYTYNEKGSMTSMVSSNGVWTKLEYDKDNNCIREENQSGWWKIAKFDEQNRCLEERFSTGGFHKWKRTILENGNTLEEFIDSYGWWQKSEYNDEYSLWHETPNTKRTTPKKRFKPNN